MITKEFIKKMPLEEKVAHMIIVRCALFDGRIDKMVENGQIGGIGAVAIKSDDFDQAIDEMNRFRSKAKLPLFFFTDGEWGLANKFDFATSVCRPMAIGAAGDEAEELAELCGAMIAREAKAMGFHIVSNPTLDVNIEPKNPIICIRAFSDDTDTVIRLGRAYIKGMQSEGIIANGKHYPGHGATAVDSHMAMPQVDRRREDLMDVELRPYKEICNDMWGVMTAHIYYPALAPEDEEGVPATLSRTVLYDILRGEFGYDNLIVSDSLTMKGIKDNYGLEAAIGAIKAGHDLILQDYVTDPKLTYDLVLDAARSGEIPMEYIDESVYRIMKFKEKLGVDNKLIDKDEVRRVVGCKEHNEISDRIARSSITVIENESLPLDAKKVGKTLVIATVGPEEREVMEDLGKSGGTSSVFLGKEVQKYIDTDVERIPEVPGAECVDKLIERIKDYDTVIMAAFIRTSSYKENSGQVDADIVRLMNALESSDAEFVSLIFGNPYSVDILPRFKNCQIAYGDDIHAIKASVAAAFGEFKAKGKLPVNINDRYYRGYSVSK